METLRREYAEQLPARIGELLFAVDAALDDSGDLEKRTTARRLAHKLAGSATTFGFGGVSENAAQLEHLLGKGSDFASIRKSAEETARAATGAAREPSGKMRVVQLPIDPVQSPLEGFAPLVRRVYVLEDDIPLQRRLTAQFELLGYEVNAFSDPSEFVAIARASRPTGVVVDVVFPEGDTAGTDALAAIQETYAEPIPAVVLSVRSDLAARLGAIRGQAQAYLTKPVDTAAVVEALDILVRTQASPPRVLMVDDDPNVTRFFRLAFEQDGFAFLACHEPLQVHEAAAEFHPDVLVLDLHMPEFASCDLVAALRQDPAWAGIPIVFLSTENDPLKREEALLAGADDFVSKQSSPRTLIQLVKSRYERSREIRSLIARDGLTGLANRATLLSHLEVECARARRRGETVAFAMLDLDDFKAINDRFGHPSGDNALRLLAHLLGRRLRREDLAGRYGGEEFGIVLPATDGPTAVRVVDEVREAFAALRIPGPKGAEIAVSFSAGIASLPPAASVAVLVEAADEALYRAKRSGKNRTELASPGPGRSAS